MGRTGAAIQPATATGQSGGGDGTAGGMGNGGTRVHQPSTRQYYRYQKAWGWGGGAAASWGEMSADAISVFQTFNTTVLYAAQACTIFITHRAVKSHTAN